MPNSTSPAPAKPAQRPFEHADRSHNRCRPPSASPDRASTPAPRSNAGSCSARSRTSISVARCWLSAAEPPLPQNISLPPPARLRLAGLDHADHGAAEFPGDPLLQRRRLFHHRGETITFGHRTRRSHADESASTERPGPMPEKSAMIGNSGYCAVQPPSIDNGTPVMVLAASEHRNTASPPICSGVENCAIGCFSVTNACVSFSTVVPSSFARSCQLLLHQWRQHPSWADRVDRDARIRQLDRGDLRHAEHAVLRRDIGDFVRAARPGHAPRRR